MENVKRVGMLFIALITLIIVTSIIFIVNINLKDNNSKSLNEDSKTLSTKEITSLLKLVNIYDSYIITFDGTKDIKTSFYIGTLIYMIEISMVAALY